MPYILRNKENELTLELHGSYVIPVDQNPSWNQLRRPVGVSTGAGSFWRVSAISPLWAAISAVTVCPVHGRPKLADEHTPVTRVFASEYRTRKVPTSPRCGELNSNNQMVVPVPGWPRLHRRSTGFGHEASPCVVGSGQNLSFAHAGPGGVSPRDARRI